MKSISMHHYFISFSYEAGLQTGFGNMNITLNRGPWGRETRDQVHDLLRKSGIPNPVLLHFAEITGVSDSVVVDPQSDLTRLGGWIASGDTGLSSKTLVAFMTGSDLKGVERIEAPSCPWDLGRCLRLLEIFPEWKPRMPEMVSVSEAWAKIMPHWDEAAKMLEDEVGIHWEKGAEAFKTYEFMKSVGF